MSGGRLFRTDDPATVKLFEPGCRLVLCWNVEATVSCQMQITCMHVYICIAHVYICCLVTLSTFTKYFTLELIEYSVLFGK